MKKGKLTARQVVLILLIVATAFLVIAAIVSIVRTPIERPAQPNEDRFSLVDADLSHTRLEMRLRGPIVADENFRSYRLSVSSTERVITTYRGYENTVIETKSLPNNSAAFRQFVDALNLQNFTRETGPAPTQDGVCAIGQIVSFEIFVNGVSRQNMWTSSCNGAPGNFGGNESRVRLLFQRQIPGFDELVRGTGLN